ncbi:MAG: glycine cleavage system protein H [Acidobacteriota bacterium]|nr:glycine cleavage system protein H [Acidobacteriota bacterium]MDH3523107.1 glycine cleavage system protein H [Acidobacteriota bacterium]
MEPQKIRLRECLAAAAVVLVLIAALPLLGVGLFVLRFVLVALAVAALTAGVVAFAASRRFRRRFLAAIGPRYDYKGLHLSTDVALDPAHSWALVDPDGAFVGVDDLAAACLGPVERVELPATGRRVERGEALFTLSRAGRDLPVPSPVSGTVSARNEALVSDPQRVNRDPFGLGWVARLRTDNPRAQRRRLLRGLRAQEFFRHEVDRLVGTLGSDSSAITSLADGGAVVADLHRAIDFPTWQRLRRQFFAAGREEEALSATRASE